MSTRKVESHRFLINCSSTEVVSSRMILSSSDSGYLEGKESSLIMSSHTGFVESGGLIIGLNL